jgi:hypothetical protein
MSSGLFGSETNVLVVEDEMVLRMRAVDIVEDAGFTAIEAIRRRRGAHHSRIAIRHLAAFFGRSDAGQYRWIKARARGA